MSPPLGPRARKIVRIILNAIASACDEGYPPGSNNRTGGHGCAVHPLPTMPRFAKTVKSLSLVPLLTCAGDHALASKFISAWMKETDDMKAPSDCVLMKQFGDWRNVGKWATSPIARPVGPKRPSFLTSEAANR